MSARHERETATLVEAIGAGGLLIAAYTPWVVTSALFMTVPVRGVDTSYGRMLVLVPLTAFGLLAWRWYARRARWVHVAIAVLGLITGALVATYAVQVKENVARAQQSLTRSGQAFPGTVQVTFDMGSYLAVASALALLVGGILGIREDNRHGGGT